MLLSSKIKTFHEIHCYQQSRLDAKEWYENANQQDDYIERGINNSGRPTVTHWKKPPERWIKYNVDDSFTGN